jgi:hypothetical protein
LVSGLLEVFYGNKAMELALINVKMLAILFAKLPFSLEMDFILFRVQLTIQELLR